jgi:ATP-dependent DNA helicase RecG
MNPADLQALLAGDEQDRVEKTTSGTDTDKFGEAICAFANDLPGHRRPGYLFIGSNKDGTASGLPITEQLLANLGGIGTDGNLQPPPSIVVQKVTLGGGEMAVVEVQPSRLPPVRYKGTVWIRRGPRRGRASVEDERVLTERRQASEATWDARTCPGATLDDLALDLFTLAYRARAVDRRVVDENQRPLVQQLAALRLYNDRGDHQGPSNGGVIVLGLDVLRFMPGAYIQYVRYGGPDKSAVLREQRIVGDLLTVLRGLDQLAEGLVGARPMRSGAREETVCDWPLVALHELFVNAVVHRDYESTAPVSISEFDDRLEILSPGGLYGMPVEAFPDAQGYRNPVLTEAARVYGFANRFGRGINAAQAALKANGSEPARFDVRFHHVLCSLARRR